MGQLEWTGERLTSEVTDQYGTIEHLHRYALALRLSQSKIVLDIASGEGYGTNLISKYASHVYGVDISEEAIKHSKEKYETNTSNITFLQGSTSKIPLPDNHVDLVVSFETIEHHDEHIQMISEIKRVLKEDGLCILSSPEKSIYHDRDPYNTFHIKELTLEELKNLITPHFQYYHIFEQQFIIGSFISKELDNNANIVFFNGDFNQIYDKLSEDIFFNKVFFNIILFSNKPITITIPPSSFFDGSKVLYRRQETYDYQINKMQQKIDKIKNSLQYKIASALTNPLSILKQIIRRVRH